jgi:hypothetical protein
MSDGMKKALLWLTIILLVAYLGNINLAGLAQGLIHAAQQVHNSNAH